MGANREAHAFGMLLAKVISVRKQYHRRWTYCAIAIEPNASDARIAEILAGIRAKFSGLRATANRPINPPSDPPPSKMAGDGGGRMRRIVRKGNSMS